MSDPIYGHVYNPPVGAFPVVVEHTLVESGMKLRDYFAIRLAAAAIAPGSTPIPEHQKYIAEWAYKMADAMLTARRPKERT